MWFFTKKWDVGLLAGYLFLVLAMTVLARASGERGFELVPFWSWRKVFAKWPIPKWRLWLLYQNLLNIAMFIPIGYLFGRKMRRKAILIATGFSLLIELIQLFSLRGMLEIDDIIHNIAGAAIGYGLCLLLRRIRKNDVR